MPVKLIAYQITTAKQRIKTIVLPQMTIDPTFWKCQPLVCRVAIELKRLEAAGEFLFLCLR